jgi:hypothetical protein
VRALNYSGLPWNTTNLPRRRYRNRGPTSSRRELGTSQGSLLFRGEPSCASQRGRDAFVGSGVMSEQQPRVEDYLDRAAKLRELARSTRFPEVRTRLVMMAAGFERLADQVEKWENSSLATMAD